MVAKASANQKPFELRFPTLMKEKGRATKKVIERRKKGDNNFVWT